MRRPALPSMPSPHPTGPGRPARTNDLAVIPAAVVHPLAQQLDGWLGAICLQGWHIQVIDEEDEVAPQGRPKHTLSPVGRGCVSPAPTGTRSSGKPGVVRWQLPSASSELLDLLSSPLSYSEHPGTSCLVALSLGSLQVESCLAGRSISSPTQVPSPGQAPLAGLRNS